MLSDILDQLIAGRLHSTKEGGLMELGTKSLPSLPRHSRDRNRTSPFAFTGNKFEFRAAGASSTISWPCTVMNTIVADSIADLCDQIEAAVGPHPDPERTREVVLPMLAEIAREHMRVVFNGDNYAEEWHEEAARRGLPHLRTSEDAYEVYKHPEVLGVFARFNVLSEREVLSRYNTFVSNFRTELIIEARKMLVMIRGLVLPAAASVERLAGALSSGAAAG